MGHVWPQIKTRAPIATMRQRGKEGARDAAPAIGHRPARYVRRHAGLPGSPAPVQYILAVASTAGPHCDSAPHQRRLCGGGGGGAARGRRGDTTPAARPGARACCLNLSPSTAAAFLLALHLHTHSAPSHCLALAPPRIGAEDGKAPTHICSSTVRSGGRMRES